MTGRNYMIVGLALALATASPALAQTVDLSPVQTLLQGIVDALTGTLGLVIGTLALIAVGLAWLFGYIDWSRAIYTVLGVVLVAAAPVLAATLFA